MKNNINQNIFRGKKAFVFTLDIAIAVLITILVMAAAHRNMANSEANRLSSVQMMAYGSDVVALLDHNGVLQTIDQGDIESGMNDLLPQNYDMLLKITYDDGTVLYAGDSVPRQQFVGTGKRFFAIADEDSVKGYGNVIYWIWTRQR